MTTAPPREEVTVTANNHEGEEVTMNNNTTSEQYIKHFERYLPKGWEVPIPLAPNSKYPPVPGVTGRIPDVKRSEIPKLWKDRTEDSNVGLRMQVSGGYDVISIDVDQYDEKRGKDNLVELMETLGELPLHEWPRSTRRGVDSDSAQFFVRVPKGLEFRDKVCADVDIVQKNHRYSVVWPSRVDGEQYRWYISEQQIDIPHVNDLPILPEVWVDYLKRDSLLYADAPAVPPRGYEDALTWLEGRVLGGESDYVSQIDWEDVGGRHDAMRSEMWSLICGAVFEGRAGLLADLENLRSGFLDATNGAPERVSAYERALVNAVAKIEGAITSGMRPDFNWLEMKGIPNFGDLLAKQADAYRAKQTKKIGSWRDRAMSGVWLDAQEFPELQWTVPGLIPEGYGVIVAPPKAGKSWFVANIGLAAAGGGKALGSIDVPQRPVLYLALEDGPRRLQDRYRKLTGGAPIPEALESITEASRDEALAWIEEFATEFAEQRPLIILDTLGKVMGQKSSNQSAYAHDYEEGSRLKRIAATMPGGTLLVVHHTNKGQHDDFQDAVSGTQGIAGAADFTMHLARKRKSPQGFLSITGRDVTENEYAVTFQDNGLWTLDGGTLDAAAEAVEDARAEDKQNNLPKAQGQSLQILRKAGDEGMTATEFAAKAGITQDAARKRLNRMAEEDVILKTEDKRYKAPEIPRSVPLVRQAPDKLVR